MFMKSLILVLTTVVAVLGYSTYTNYQYLSSLPSAYDPGVAIETAFKESPHPILIEFYTDQCGTCQKVTPAIHEIATEQFSDRLTLVMMNLENPENTSIAQLFGVETIPAVFVFNPKKMKKERIPLESMATYGTLTKAMEQALAATSGGESPARKLPNLPQEALQEAPTTKPAS